MTEFEVLAANVRRRREEQGLSIGLLAKEVGMTVYSIEKLEAGTPIGRFGVEQLRRLAVVFHCSIAEMFKA